MKYHAKGVVKRVEKILDSGNSERKKYGQIMNMILKHARKEGYPNVPEESKPSVEFVQKTDREAIRNIIPILMKIYIDPGTREIFSLVLRNPHAQIIMTSDFIEFLDKVSQEKE